MSGRNRSLERVRSPQSVSLKNARLFAAATIVSSLAAWCIAADAPATPAVETPAPYVPGSRFPSRFPVTGKYDWTPGQPNAPIGSARGINPGRVVWVRDPGAAHWAGRWKLEEDQWWTDANTDQAKVDGMMSAMVRRLTSTATDKEAWQAVFRHHNGSNRGYKPGEIVAIKVNLNNAERSEKKDNLIDASPHMVLALIRQLVREAGVKEGDIFVYDARRFIPGQMLRKVWAEYPEVRFVQQAPAREPQPTNPKYGDFHGLESAEWVPGVEYSSDGKYDKAKLIPKQVQDAAYLVNFALMKLHSYPYNTMENGDEGQTALTMTGKNHFGSILGTAELHADINTAQKGRKGAYSPMVDLAAAPNLGAKTILYMLDGLYCGRKWKSYPLHFPNPPFNNRVEPYENPDWPASLLGSFDGVALDSVGLDILYSQTKNNGDPRNDNLPRILVRENADDYLVEMADPQHAPSGVAYTQGGNPVESLGVHEHWDADATRRYSRNLDPINGKGIDLQFLPLGDAPLPQPVATLAAGAAPGERVLTLTCAARNAKIHYTTDSTAPTERSPVYTGPVTVPAGTIVKATAFSDTSVESPVVLCTPLAPAALPGKGLAQHPFMYAGEWDYRNPNQTVFIVRDGKVVWTYDIKLLNEARDIQEYSDASLLSNGNVLFAMKTGAMLVSPEKKVLWSYLAPRGFEVHVSQPLGLDRVMLVQIGKPAKMMIVNTTTGKTEKEFEIPVGKPDSTHGQLRRARITAAGTLLVAHMDNNKVAEYDMDGRVVWSLEIPSPWAAVRLKSGNTLISSNKKFVREVDRNGKTVWELTMADLPDYILQGFQEANRLANGNTLVTNWCPGGLKDPRDWPQSVQALEITPDKKVVWALRSWDDPANFGPATCLQLLDEPGTAESGAQQR